MARNRIDMTLLGGGMMPTVPQTNAPYWLGGDLSRGWTATDPYLNDALQSAAPYPDMPEGVVDQTYRQASEEAAAEPPITPDQMMLAQTLFDEASRGADDYADLAPFLETGAMLAESLKRDFDPLTEAAYQAADLYAGGKNFGEKLNEARARKINAINALSTQLNTMLSARPKPRDLEYKEFKEGNEIVTYALLPDGRRVEVARAPASQAQQKTSDAIQQYEYAREQGYEGTFQQWKKDMARAGRTEVSVTNVGPTGIDYGDPEKGLVWARNPDGTVKLDERGAPIAVPYQGGSVYRETVAEEDKKKVRQLQREKYGSVLVEDVGRALEIAETSEWPTTGFLGWLSSALPGTPAFNLARLLDTITANIGFDRLQEMRAASPTGGALGQVSNFENQLLQSVLGSVRQSQSKEQFIYNLKRVGRIYEKIIHEGISEDDPLAQDVLDDPTVAPIFEQQRQEGFDPYSEFGLDRPGGQ